MTESTVEDRVMETFNEIITLPEGADRSLEIKSLNLDSLDITELVMKIEEEFDGVIVKDSAVEAWKTIGDVIDDVERWV